MDRLVLDVFRIQGIIGNGHVSSCRNGPAEYPHDAHVPYGDVVAIHSVNMIALVSADIYDIYFAYA